MPPPKPLAMLPTKLCPIPRPVNPFKLFARLTVAPVNSCTDPDTESKTPSTEILPLCANFLAAEVNCGVAASIVSEKLFPAAFNLEDKFCGTTAILYS